MPHCPRLAALALFTVLAATTSGCGAFDSRSTADGESSGTRVTADATQEPEDPRDAVTAGHDPDNGAEVLRRSLAALSTGKGTVVERRHLTSDEAELDLTSTYTTDYDMVGQVLITEISAPDGEGGTVRTRFGLRDETPMLELPGDAPDEPGTWFKAPEDTVNELSSFAGGTFEVPTRTLGVLSEPVTPVSLTAGDATTDTVTYTFAVRGDLAAHLIKPSPGTSVDEHLERWLRTPMPASAVVTADGELRELRIDFGSMATSAFYDRQPDAPLLQVEAEMVLTVAPSDAPELADVPQPDAVRDLPGALDGDLPF